MLQTQRYDIHVSRDTRYKQTNKQTNGLLYPWPPTRASGNNNWVHCMPRSKACMHGVHYNIVHMHALHMNAACDKIQAESNWRVHPLKIAIL